MSFPTTVSRIEPSASKFNESVAMYTLAWPWFCFLGSSVGMYATHLPRC